MTPAPDATGQNSGSVTALPAEEQFTRADVGCASLNSRPTGSVTHDQRMVACDVEGLRKYLLDVAKVDGSDLSAVDAVRNDARGE